MELLERWVAVWRESSTSFPQLGREFSEQEQQVREALLEQFLGSVEAEALEPPCTRPEREETRERITSAFVQFARSALDLGDRHLELLLGFSSVGTDLARQARRFDPSVSTKDILQACRNAWTACGLQVLLGETMRVTPAIFAYSMLYPYTDNYLDDPTVSRQAKLGFSRRFGRRLAGVALPPANDREANIWRLVAQIEGQYARRDHPQVFDSLLAIHDAQEKSIRLLRHNAPAHGVDVLRLSFQKGGASVLADGHLAAGSLDADEAEFTFGWGVLLQLADDLQDIQTDRQDGVLTLFSQVGGRQPLDDLTNRALHFADAVMGRLDGVVAPGSETLKELIKRSSQSLLIRSAGAAGELYTQEYLAALESHSPFRFSFLGRRQSRLERWSGLFAKLFEAFLAGEENEPAFPLLPSVLMPRF